MKKVTMAVLFFLLLASTITMATRSIKETRSMDDIEIHDLNGGFGVSATIRNTGNSSVSDVVWSIDFNKFAIGKYSSGTISTIPPDEEVVVRSGFVFGIGRGNIKIIANDVLFLQKYLMFGPFIFLLQGTDQLIKNYNMSVYYRDSELVTLDPADAYDAESTDVISQVYDTLVTFHRNDSLTIYPCLATDWTVSSDSKQWTFSLRDNVKFSNGNTFTADDVAYSFNRVLIMGAPESGVDWILAQCMNTESTMVLNDHTVQITLTHPYGGFLALLAHTVASIVDKDYVEEHGGVIPGEENIWMKEHPMGTGPYVLDHWSQGTEILLTKNPMYWDGWKGNHIEKVFFKIVTNLEERISAIKNGDTDFVSIPIENLGEVIGEKGIVVQPFDTFHVELLAMNTKMDNNKYLADGVVRHALNFAFNYDTALDTALQGYASRLAGAIPVGMPYYMTQHNGQPFYEYNLTKAEQILDDSGYLKDFDINGTFYRFNGTSIRLFYNTGNMEREMMAVIFQEALTQIGIRSSVIAEDWPDLLHRLYTTEDWDMMFVGWGPNYNDPDDYIAPLIGSSDIGQDTYHTGYTNGIVDEKILEAKYSADSSVRTAAYKAAYDVYIQESPMIFIGQRMLVRPMRDWMQNYCYNPSPGLSWNFYECWKGQQQIGKLMLRPFLLWSFE
jgi:ABC-type transport system substrate-binding protein